MNGEDAPLPEMTTLPPVVLPPQLPADPIDRIRAVLEQMRKQWDPRAWAYVHDVDILLRRNVELERLTRVVAEAPTTVERKVGTEPADFARGWRACCSFIAEEVSAELTRGNIARWDVYRMRRAMGEIVELARRRRLDA